MVIDMCLSEVLIDWLKWVYWRMNVLWADNIVVVDDVHGVRHQTEIWVSTGCWVLVCSHHSRSAGPAGVCVEIRLWSKTSISLVISMPSLVGSLLSIRWCIGINNWQCHCCYYRCPFLFFLYKLLPFYFNFIALFYTYNELEHVIFCIGAVLVCTVRHCFQRDVIFLMIKW